MSKNEYMRDVAKAFVQHGFVESDGQIYIDVRHKEIDGKVKAVVVVGIDENGLNTEAIMDIEDARDHFHGVMKACQVARHLMLTDEERQRLEALKKTIDEFQSPSHAEKVAKECHEIECRIFDAVNNAASILATEGYSAEATELQDAIGAFFGTPKEEGKNETE